MLYTNGTGQAASSYAWANGKTTFADTTPGTIINNMREAGNPFANVLTRWGSKKFAQNMSGEVEVFGLSQGFTNPNSVYRTSELPALLQEPTVTNIIPQ